MIILKTRYLGPTDTKGSRIKASWYESTALMRPFKRSITVPYSHRDTARECHRMAAHELWEKYTGQGWSSADWHSVETEDRKGYLFVNVTQSDNVLRAEYAEE